MSCKEQRNLTWLASCCVRSHFLSRLFHSPSARFLTRSPCWPSDQKRRRNRCQNFPGPVSCGTSRQLLRQFHFSHDTFPARFRPLAGSEEAKRCEGNTRAQKIRNTSAWLNVSAGKLTPENIFTARKDSVSSSKAVLCDLIHQSQTRQHPHIL